MRLTNPGQYPIIDTRVSTAFSRRSAELLLAQSSHCIARGAGLSIGDGALNDTLVLSTRGLNRILSFDERTGILIAETGTILADIADIVVPRGWALPTTPGTNLISLGGAIASDVHGKNHHAVGSFDRHILWLDVLTAAQGVVRCSPTEHADLFNATCGGIGLTGLILAAAVQLMRVGSAWIKEIGIKTRDFAHTLETCAEYASHPYLVAWVDPHARGRKMGRGYVMCGEPASADEAAEAALARGPARAAAPGFRIPAYVPVPTLDFYGWTKTINALYAVRARHGTGGRMIRAEAFFSPIQSVDLRMFGGGHITYQFTLPFAARDAFAGIFRRVVESGSGSFISVLKLFGPQQRLPGNISFPQEGYNLGIDFRVSRGMFALFRELDALVLDHGGRHYLTKDVCLTPEDVRRGYGDQLDGFLAVKRKWDPDNRFRSLQSMRLQLH